VLKVPHPSNIQMFYQFGIETDNISLFQGFIHPPSSTRSTFQTVSPTDPLPALPLNTLHLSTQEVLHVIPLPLSHLIPSPSSFSFSSSSSSSPNESELNLVRRRLRKRVTSDRIGPGSTNSILGQDYLAIRNLQKLIDTSGSDEGDEDFDLKSLEVWGLTAWMINVLFVRLGVIDILEEAAAGCKSIEKDEELVRRLSEGTKSDDTDELTKSEDTELTSKL
jgi:hypothetical protein